MCASVVRALHLPDPANPLDRTFPLRIPLISYGAADDDLQSSVAYPYFARSVLSTTAEVEALLSAFWRWRVCVRFFA